jgi:hypothetical protein
MRKLLPIIAIVLAWASVAGAAAPIPLTTIKSIQALTNAQAGEARPVAFEGTVTYFRGYRKNLFVQDGDAGMFVKAATRTRMAPGDRVLIKGITATGFRPCVYSSDITVIGHGAEPKPVPATFDQLIRGSYDSLLVTMRGVVHSADLDRPSAAHVPGATLRMLTDGGYVDVEVDSGDAQALGGLLDNQVAVTAVAGGKFDGKLQLTGVVLHVASFADIKVLKRPAVSPWALPATPMDQVLSVYHINNLTRRVRITGSVTYFEPGSAMVLQSGSKSIWVKTESFTPMRIGDRAEVIGFPAVSDGFLVVGGSEIQDSGIPAPVSPQPVTWQQLASSRSIFDLVSIEGQVAMEAREPSQDEYVLVSDGKMFTAIYPHGNTAGALMPMKQVPIGARIRVTGICAMDNANPFGHDVPFNILMRSSGDLVLLAQPSWLTVRHLTFLVFLLLLAVIAVGTRVWFVERTMRSQVVALGYIEQRRGRILEAINSSQPLAETLEQITELASVVLKGAPCWCQIADGATLGNYPQRPGASGLRIVEHPIGSHSGPPLGSIFAAFDAHVIPQAAEAKSLSMAAALAALAIETRRLYSDLVRRSEFDMLTDVHNRFSLEKNLDAHIQIARQTAGVFGLIYPLSGS